MKNREKKKSGGFFHVWAFSAFWVFGANIGLTCLTFPSMTCIKCLLQISDVDPYSVGSAFIWVRGSGPEV